MSSGIAAALLMAAPAGVAVADELIGSDTSSPNSVTEETETSSPESAESSEAGESAGQESADEAPADDEAADEPTESPAEEESAHEPPADEPPAQTGTYEPESGDAESGDSESPDAADAPPESVSEDVAETAGDATAPTPRMPHLNFTPPGRESDAAPMGRHRADEAPTGRHRADSTLDSGLNAIGPSQSAPVPEVPDPVLVIDEFVAEPGTTAAMAPIVADSSVFYRLTHNSGGAGLIFLNQNLTVAGVLNRRSRGDGTDYFGLLSPGEQLTLPVRPVAELSVGDSPLADAIDDSLLVQAVRSAVAPLLWYGIDADDRYYDPSDFQVLIGDNYRIADADGITYTYDADANTITFTNTTDQDVAVIAVDQNNIPHGDGIYVVPAGESMTIDTGEDISGYVVQGERDSEGHAVIYGMVVVQDDATLSQNFNPYGGAIRDADAPIIDPEDNFWDPTEGLATGLLWPFDAVGANAGTDGVYYTTGADGVTIHNDGDSDIAIIVFRGTQDSMLIPQTEMYVIEAGTTHTIELTEGSYAFTSVQGQRVADGPDAGKPTLYGGFVALGTGDDTSVNEIDLLPEDQYGTITQGPTMLVA
ncbi:hypothetical protein [Gordonia rhizosphera]|nr:hypothetical protein [Gordonia rhizosphera]